MQVIIRALVIAAVGLAVVFLLYVGSRSGSRPPKGAGPRLKPGQPVVDIELPVVSIAGSSGEAYRHTEVALPENAAWRVSGAFHAGSREGGTLVIAEAKIPRQDRMVMSTNGVAGVMLKKNSEIDYEIVLKQPTGVSRTGIIELRLGDDEYLAICPFRIGNGN